MHAPQEMPNPANLVVYIFGDTWQGGVEGYYANGSWWLAQEGPDLQVTITGWLYKDGS